jgi:hypothetical protein
LASEYFSRNSAMVSASPPADSIFFLAALENERAPTTTRFPSSPPPRTFPGITTKSPSPASLPILPTFTRASLERLASLTAARRAFQMGLPVLL